MKQHIIFCISILLTTISQVTNAQCPPTDTIANQITSGNFSLCGIIPCESALFNDGDSSTFYTAIDCRKIASLRDSIDGISLGNVTVCETIDCSTQFFEGQPILNRHFIITPTNNGKAYVCLYVLEMDIQDYNAAAFPTWPALDPLTNLSIMQVDSFNILGTPMATITSIPNSSITSAFNPGTTVWEICFPVDSFSTFYLSTPSTSIPTFVSNFNSDASVKLYPNPAGDNLNIEMEAMGEGVSSIQIIDVTGRVLKTIKSTIKKGHNTNNINISTLAKGTYLVSISKGKELKYSKTFLKK